FREHLQAFFQPGAAEAGARGAVGLVEARLEDEGHAEAVGDLLQPAGGIELQLHGLDHARAGDQKEGTVEADLESTQLHARRSCCWPLPALYARAASMKPMNSGCPLRGVDRNSGWAWQARNQGCTDCGSSTISTSRSSMDLALITRPASSSWVR